MAGMGLGSFLQGMAGGYATGQSMERNKKLSDALENVSAKKDSGAAVSSGTAVQNYANGGQGLGLSGWQQPTGQQPAINYPSAGYTPNQDLLPSTPEAKAVTNNTGNWGTIAAYIG